MIKKNARENVEEKHTFLEETLIIKDGDGITEQDSRENDPA